jgi:hypothetical protein
MKSKIDYLVGNDSAFKNNTKVKSKLLQIKTKTKTLTRKRQEADGT